ncbi:MAG: NUDIX hydrolase [Desertimonas sp.]
MSTPPSENPAVVPALPAATVMLARDGDDGVEVFVLRRTARAAFAPDMYVFPGGKVDPADGSADIEAFTEGLSATDASGALELDEGGLAYWVAAVRECFEEASLLLARRRDGSVTAVPDEDRRALHDQELSMVELCRRHDLVLDLSEIRYIAHWVTPVGESPRRFDTRFFLAAAPDDQEGRHDDVETVHSRWVRPVDALAESAAGELALMPPTLACMGFLAEHATVDAALAAADAAGPPPRIQPKIRWGDDGKIAGVSLPGDPDYDELV